MPPGCPIYDAHNHLQDARLRDEVDAIAGELRKLGVRRWVVNGTREEDWPAVAELAGRPPEVIACFGLHPWHIRARSPGWLEVLEEKVQSFPAGVGEIGLDRWVEGSDFPDQQHVFREQWRLAVRLKRPVMVHCLRAWGALMDFLREEEFPAHGFLLHSYGGSRELIEPLIARGAYFSISGYFAHSRKERQREVFRWIPMDRLLIETDAPDMLPPPEWKPHVLADENLNHPANIAAVYEFAAGVLGVPVAELAAQVEENFNRLFGGLLH